MLQVIECAGHPRDMGLDQGRACAAAVRSRLRRAGLAERRSRFAGLAPFVSGPVRGAGPGREIVRHFTHLSERIDGLARAAGVPVDSLLELHIRGPAGAATGGAVDADAIALAARDLDGVPGVSLVRSLPAPPPEEGGWLVRRSRPEVGFASVEVTLPWLVSALGGVNEAGLCAAFVHAGSEAAARVSDGRPETPAVLMVQECLQRFDGLQGGLDWCQSRPISGQGTILLADAAGQHAAVHFLAGECRVERAATDALAAGGAPGVREALREAALHDRVLDLKLLEASTPAAEPGHSAAVVRLAARAHRLGLNGLGAETAEIGLEA